MNLSLSIRKQMQKLFRFILPVILSIVTVSISFSQGENNNARIGFSYMTGKQPFFPFSSPDYTYSLNGYKILFNRELKRKGRVIYEIQVEPGFYIARHRLLNEYFIQPEWGPDYLEKRVYFMEGVSIREYALNIGLQARYLVSDRIGLFALGSIGPMISDTKTERLAKGFAFSDIISLGVSYKCKKLLFEIKPGLRHVSNANLKKPNSGHNSSNIEFTISHIL
jgi:hypothetical protein